jgi:hypothetical protein
MASIRRGTSSNSGNMPANLHMEPTPLGPLSRACGRGSFETLGSISELK